MKKSAPRRPVQLDGPAFPPSRGRARGRIALLSLGAAALLAACMQNTPAREVATAPTRTETVPVSAPAVTRVVVTFDREAAGAAFDSPTFIKEMRSRLLADVAYLGPVGGTTHVYSVQPQTGQTLKQVMQRLGNMLIVRSAEIDQRMKAQ
jgi:hypothetical protein